MTDPGPDESAGRERSGGRLSDVEDSRKSAAQRVTVAVVALAVVAGLIALGFVVLSPVPLSSASPPPASCACSLAPAASFPASPIDGVVVKVDSTGIGNVRGFTMRVAGGATLDLTLGTLENAAQFAPGHLTEHEATATPVRAYFVVNGGIPVVYRLEDAPAASSSP